VGALRGVAGHGHLVGREQENLVSGGGVYRRLNSYLSEGTLAGVPGDLGVAGRCQAKGQGPEQQGDESRSDLRMFYEFVHSYESFVVSNVLCLCFDLFSVTLSVVTLSQKKKSRFLSRTWRGFWDRENGDDDQNIERSSSNVED
jgi:hypothetical protein